MFERRYNLHIGASAPPITLDCTKGDTAWRWFFRVFNSGKRVSLDGYYAKISGIRPDGSVFDVAGSIENNEIKIESDQSITARVGVIPSIINVYDHYGKTVASCKIVIVCKESAIDTESIQGDTIRAYSQILKNIEQEYGEIKPSPLPEISSEDNGKVLTVKNGQLVLEELPNMIFMEE